MTVALVLVGIVAAWLVCARLAVAADRAHFAANYRPLEWREERAPTIALSLLFGPVTLIAVLVNNGFRYGFKFKEGR